MKNEFSTSWNSSVQPRKQRKYRYNAPLHIRHKLVSANLAPALRKEFERRSMPLRKGDEVEIMRGSFKGFKGVIDRVDVKNLKVYVENANIKKADGTEVAKAMDPSNIKITKLILDDKKRIKVIERKESKKETEKPTKEKKAK